MKSYPLSLNVAYKNGFELPTKHQFQHIILSQERENSMKFISGLLFSCVQGSTLRDYSAHKDISLGSYSRWNTLTRVTLSDLDPVKQVDDIKYHENSDNQKKNYGVPLVNIAGIWGTICFDGLDEDTLDFLCRQLHFPDTYWGSTVNLYQSVSHLNEPFNEYPVLLNGMKCIKHASEFDDCTSEPIGYQHCESYQDLLLGCIPIN